MTQKDYRALAGAFYRAHERELPVTLGKDEMTVLRFEWQVCADYVADVLAADSPRFDRERFLRACRTGEMGKVPR